MPTLLTVLNRFRGDLFGGLTAAVVALPLTLAFGAASGLGAAAGLYGAVALGLVASLVGGSRVMLSGPTGPMTVGLALVLTMVHGDIQTLLAVIVLAGLLQMLLGLSRAGSLVRFVPYPVFSGFMSGIGVIIILQQIHPLLGAPAAASPLASILQLPNVLSRVAPASLLVGGVTMLLLYLVPARVNRLLPGPLLALFSVSGLVAYLRIDVPVVGTVSAQLPRFSVPQFDVEQSALIVALAFALALLGAMESLLAGRATEALAGENQTPNRDLFGQGLGNTVAGFLGGLAGAGCVLRTTVTIRSGATTRLSGLVYGLFFLVILFGFGRLGHSVPEAVLAGILIKLGADILDFRLLRLAGKAPLQDLLVMGVVFGLTVLSNLIFAVAAGMVISLFLLLARKARHTEIVSEDISVMKKGGEGEFDFAREVDVRIRVIDIRGPFCFAAIGRMRALFASLPEVRVVVCNCLEVPFMDISAIFTLDEMIDRLGDQGIKVVLALGPAARKRLAGLGITEKLALGCIVGSRDDAVKAARIVLSQREKAKKLIHRHL